MSLEMMKKMNCYNLIVRLPLQFLFLELAQLCSWIESWCGDEWRDESQRGLKYFSLEALFFGGSLVDWSRVKIGSLRDQTNFSFLKKSKLKQRSSALFSHTNYSTISAVLSF